MKTFKLNIQWMDGKIQTFSGVIKYEVRDGALLIWFSPGSLFEKIIPNSAYKMAWREEI